MFFFFFANSKYQIYSFVYVSAKFWTRKQAPRFHMTSIVTLKFEKKRDLQKKKKNWNGELYGEWDETYFFSLKIGWN